jgi:hypothetical protein
VLEVINLALPFFGLIFLGFGCGKFKPIPDSGSPGCNADERHVAGKDPATASPAISLTCGCRRTSAEREERRDLHAGWVKGRPHTCPEMPALR